MSVIGMVSAKEDDSTDALMYCLQGTRTDLVSWGHEYLRCLAGQVGKEYNSRVEKNQSTDEVLQLVD